MPTSLRQRCVYSRVTLTKGALSRLDPLRDELFPAEQAQIVQLLVERVDVGISGVDAAKSSDWSRSLAMSFCESPFVTR